MMKTIVDNVPIDKFLDFAREEAEKSRQHELKLTQLLMNLAACVPQQSAQAPNSSSNQTTFSLNQEREPVNNYVSYYEF